ncbi:TPA: O-antigen ligase domain-containing protein [Candidatus Poribacteria bacterium]|nr:O-antigen ligase domain-containing protein [Candidatus Poribacteria bacterium]
MYMQSLFLVLAFIVIVGVIVITICIFFRNGKLVIKRVITPLMIASVILPPIGMPLQMPAIRLELILVLVAWLLFLLGSLSTGGRIKLKWNPVYKWFFVFGITILASIVYATLVKVYYPVVSDFWEFGKLLEYFLIFALIANLEISLIDLKRYYLISLMIFSVSAIFGFAQYWNIFNINSSAIISYYAPTQTIGLLSWGHRIVGTTGNPNEFAALMVLAASLALAGALWLEDKNERLFSWLGFIVFSFSVILTLSRSGLIGLIVASAFILFFKYPMYFRFKGILRLVFAIIPILLIIVFILIKLSPSTLFFRIESVLSPTTDTSFQVRLLMWNYNLEIWKQSPLLGWGAGKATMTTIVDNEWILLLRRYGIIGLTIFLIWFTKIYSYLSQIVKENSSNYTKAIAIGLQAIFPAYAVYMTFAAVYHSLQLMPIFMLYLGLIYSQGKFARRVHQV